VTDSAGSSGFPTPEVELTHLLVVADTEVSRRWYESVDNPTVTFAAPPDPDTVSAEMIFGVPNCRAAYELLKSRGAEFLTPPVEFDWEIRAFFRDPDGHLFEISEPRGR